MKQLATEHECCAPARLNNRCQERRLSSWKVIVEIDQDSEFGFLAIRLLESTIGVAFEASVEN
jgi:hypothetical protein